MYQVTMAISKLTLIGGSAGLVSATAGGVAIYLNSGESIRDHIANKSDGNIKFISLVPEAHVSLKKRYEVVGASHKPIENGKEVTSDKIIEWCERAANTRFFKDTDPIYSSIGAWCFVNVNTLFQQAGKSSDQNIDGSDGNSDGWKNAWETYNTQKTTKKLEITGDDIGDLNTARDKNAGGPALYKWCQSSGNKKMYELGSEESLKRYERWCFKS
ncbi:hypothetical protein A6V39_04450 [Candidatus Mycoplasma haematobovis]|uniref:Uncharacterized protein n=1 Tax=Candidatus Mycoplasma haematobovis TaxID=432608 RepID=A0A1A9QDW3_9MOLU|nr:hypothetical protein [Candidatus Mycoplasma haematobovis]OAL10135.1 hypothetical protein A6V39_04450 [Candidatus Mycoplasma haematobovis]